MRYVPILALACQPYFAISFLYGAVPAILRRNGASLETIGLFGLVFFAFTINFLWSPLIDRLSLTRYGRRRSWLFLTQFLTILLFIVLGILNPTRQFSVILAVGMLLAALAATQRSVILGYAAEALGEHEKAWGAAAFGWGTTLGNIVGGTLGLYLVDTAGWETSLLVLAGIMVVVALSFVKLVEPAAPSPDEKPALAVAMDGRAWIVIAILTPATYGLAVAFAMTQPRLVDLGFGLTSIGMVAAVANLIAATVAGPLTGWLATRLPIRQVISAGAVVIAILHIILIGFSVFSGEWAAALTAVIVVFSAICAVGIASNTLFLKIAGHGNAAATEVTFFSAAMSLVALAGFMSSGFIATAGGYGATLAVAASGSFLTGLAAAICWPALATTSRNHRG